MEKARTTPAKHIFLDVVGFTHNRSVEAQADIVGLLNKYISDCLEQNKVPQEPELTQHIAYYIAYAIKNYPALVPDKGFHAENVAITLLYFLANDSVDRANVTELEAFYPKTYQTESATFEEQYKYYSEIDENLVWYFARIVRWPPQDYLSRYNNCFAKDSFGMNLYRAVNDHGKRKLKAEWPQIWEELELHKYTNL